MVTVELVDDFLLLGFFECNYYRKKLSVLDSVANEGKGEASIDLDEFDEFEKLFKGELYFKTPRWKITKEEPPKVNIELKKDYPVPRCKEGINVYKYQQFGYKFILNKLKEKGFCILGDVCGLGKTLISILTFTYLLRKKDINKTLILCKKSIKKQWKKEIDKFTTLSDELDYIDFVPEGATKGKRDIMYEKMKTSKTGILITTFESCLNDSKQIIQAGFDMVVIDEAHTIKSPTGMKNAAISECVKSLKYKLLVTGTPITNKPMDLLGLVSLCDCNYFEMSMNKFSKRYVKHYHNGKYHLEIGFQHIDELRDKCQDIMIRRTENEVELELPKIKYIDVICKKDKLQISLTRRVMGLFKKATDKMENLDKNDKNFLKEKEKLDNQRKGILAYRQVICNDPNIFNYGKSAIAHKIVDNDNDFFNYKGSNKTDKLINMVEQVVSKDRKVIIFSKHERTVRYLKDRLSHVDTNIVTFTGKLKESERNDNIDLFVEDEDCKVLIGTNAMAEGLNLNVANYLINYDLPDTVALAIQRMGRVRRVGSEYTGCIVYNLITEGSVDERKKDNLNKQKDLFDSIVELSQEESSAIRDVSN